ncbi:hypothetical protein TcasGA2_TC032627 [Tribolium castaneum]|uniref:Uncharacterized protein n=1 Tax=Tribolium castaneum TaxID=7070 RepID=A0A139WJV3_TRICA|nr:hypothetical protein TcasGA2_TC032627 [Tribolium castaneum]
MYTHTKTKNNMGPVKQIQNRSGKIQGWRGKSMRVSSSASL